MGNFILLYFFLSFPRVLLVPFALNIFAPFAAHFKGTAGPLERSQSGSVAVLQNGDKPTRVKYQHYASVKTPFAINGRALIN